MQNKFYKYKFYNLWLWSWLSIILGVVTLIIFITIFAYDNTKYTSFRVIGNKNYVDPRFASSSQVFKASIAVSIMLMIAGSIGLLTYKYQSEGSNLLVRIISIATAIVGLWAFIVCVVSYLNFLPINDETVKNHDFFAQTRLVKLLFLSQMICLPFLIMVSAINLLIKVDLGRVSLLKASKMQNKNKNLNKKGEENAK